MRYGLLQFSAIIFLACVVILAGAAVCHGAQPVTEIRVEGNERVDSTSILNALALGIGDTYSEFLVTSSVRNIFRLGAFSRVAVAEEFSDQGVVLTVSVTEYPMIRRIEFSGRRSIKEEELKDALALKVFSFADPGRVAGEIEAIEAVYRAAGYHGTTVEYDTRKVEKGVVVVYTIEESEKSLVHEVDIIGNRSIEDRKIKKVMQNKEIGPLSFISGSGGYDDKAAEDDNQRIRYIYMEEGFLDIRVGEPDITLHPDGEGLYVSLEVQEGPQYTLGAVKYSGEWTEPPDHLRREPEVKVGDTFVRSSVMNDIKMYEDSYRDKGFAWCRVEPFFEKDPVKAEVTLNLVLTKGPPVHIRWIHISGNSKTRDYVIRREMRIGEGDLYDQASLDDSARFIRRLGFFPVVDIRPVKVGEGLADIRVKVEEGSAGTFTAGASYSNVSGLVGTFQLSLGNFSGRGQRLNFSIESGSETSTYSISFSEPRLFSGVFSFNLDLFNKTNTYSEYTQDSRGLGVGLGYRLSDASNISARYRFVNYDVYDIDLDASALIREQEGETTTSSLRLGYNYDTRDFPRDPREGFNLKFTTEIAGGPFGGENDFLRYQAEGSFFKTLIGDLIGVANLELGLLTPYGSGDIPVTEKYFMGGLYTLRGFEFRKVGPLEDGEPLGGTKSILLNLEATYPLVRDTNIKGVLFFDTGNVWAEEENVDLGDLRYGAGFGFRWVAPIGLLRLEWGFNLDPRPDEEQPGWEFSIGTLF